MQGSKRLPEANLRFRSINLSFCGYLKRPDSLSRIVRLPLEPVLSLAPTLLPLSVSHFHWVETLTTLSSECVQQALSLSSPSETDFQGFDLLHGSEQRTRNSRPVFGAR